MRIVDRLAPVDLLDQPAEAVANHVLQHDRHGAGHVLGDDERRRLRVGRAVTRLSSLDVLRVEFGHEAA